MSSREFSEWQAYFGMHPFGPEMDEIIGARICASVANFSGTVDWKKHPNPFQPKDFLPDRKPDQTPADQLEIIKLINAAQGA